MRFVVDESSWHFDGLPYDVCIEALEAMLDQLDDAQSQGHLACYSEELFNTSVWQDKSFYDLYSADSPIPIPREIRERVGSIFNSLSKWQDLLLTWPSSFEIQVDKAPLEEAPSVAWAHEQTLQNPAHAIACIVFSNGRQGGAFVVTVDNKMTVLWFVADSTNYQYFFRWLIVETTKKPAEMEYIAPSAFPSLDFVEGAFNGIKDMKGSYRDLIKALVNHLGAFSDHGQRIFQGPWTMVAAEFGSLGIDISDENGNTKSDNDARKKRTIEFDGTGFLFWWHSKLEPHQNRIHINPDRISNGGRLLVGIFCYHL
jgi:hypothetical protein